MTETILPNHCTNHPNVETMLRCSRCEKPICPKCAIKSPVGYRCPECIRSQQKIFETAIWSDYLFGAIAAAFLSGVASTLIGLIGMIGGFFGWFLIAAAAPTAGVAIAEGARFVIKKRRSRNLFLTISAAVVVGALPAILSNLVGLDFFGFAFQVIYLVLAVPTVYTRSSGIQLFK